MINKKHLNKFVLILSIGYFFRLIFGLNYDFWFADNLQVYLIGLKFYTTGLWPYWGPDVIHSGSVISGALQGLLVGLPIFLFKIPEAPLIFLNLMSIFSLAFFAWYLSRRIDSIPKPVILIYLLTLPCCMYYSTTVQNPSYVLIAAILFFISIFELFPFYSEKIIPENVLFFIMGFSLFWIYQLHLSWILLIPYIVLSFYFKFNEDKKIASLIKPMLFFMVGCLICLGTLLPTLIQFHQTSAEALTANISLNFSNIIRIFDIVLNFLSFGTFEVEKFVPENFSNIKQFFATYYWLAPLVLFLFLIRIAQFIYLIIVFWKNKLLLGWGRVQYFIVFSLSLLWLSFMFSEHFPTSHKFYLMMPISIWYSLQAYQGIYKNRQGRIFANFFLSAGILFYILLSVIYFHTGHSLYSNRGVVEKAIKEMDYTFLGTRREFDFERRQRGDIWKSSVFNDSIVYFTGLEYERKYFLPQNISSKKSHSGLYSCKIDSVQPFSTGLAITCIPLSRYRRMKISMWVLPSIPQTDAELVVSVQDSDKTVFWNGTPLKRHALKSGSWQKISDEIVLSAGKSVKGMINVYVWNPAKTGELVYIDDIKMCFY